ncbi:MAG: DNA mismatch repair endonuclease MutL, partial [Spirochaetales bacterium]
MSQPQARIHLLDPLVARRIAAGEVVERPHGVVRELMDNSIDAGARHVEVYLQAGGNESIRVIDDGAGMGPEDLRLCVESHATSKITTDHDLLSVRTLGFRGEALASIAAVSRLSITSAPSDGIPHTIEVDAGSIRNLAPSAGQQGTTVEVSDLFFNVPARKRFLKRTQTEASMCRGVFLDKAVGFVDVEFRLYLDGELRHFLPPGTIAARIAAAYPERTEPALLHQLTGSGEGFTFALIAGEPRAARKDRRQLQVFVNRRRVWEYALIQALEYAYRDYLHGGIYPVAYLFLDIDPELVDFNIHPTKREVRFRSLPEIHRRVVEVVSSHLRQFDRTMSPFVAAEPTLPYSTASPPGEMRVSPHPATVFDLTRVFDPGLSDSPDDPAGAPASGTPTTDGITPAIPDFRYLGQVMGVFLIVERENQLYLVDQHAAHERIIYDRLTRGSGGQELLFPVYLDIGEDEAKTLDANKDELSGLGIRIERNDGAWALVSTPAGISISAEDLAGM